MKYRVRNADGEMEFASLEALRVAAHSGLVDPSDEVLREDETTWTRASAMGAIGAQAAKPKVSPQTVWILGAVALGVGAFVMLLKGRDDPQYYAYGVMMGFVVAGILFKVTRDSAKRR